MIGIDLTRISRFKNKSKTFIKRVLSKAEIANWDGEDTKYLAVRWAVKEALFKVDNKLSVFNKITITHDGVKYFYKNNYVISTSDEDDYIIVIVLRKDQQCH
jgi:holo-[acyl-carrier protein] synthase